MALPNRLEGAVLGQLVAAVGGDDESGGTLLDELEMLLDRFGSPGQRTAATSPSRRIAPSPDLALAAALVLRDSPVAEMAASAVSAASGPSADPSAAESALLYALVVRRIVRGERNRRSALAHARRDATRQDVGPVRGVTGAGTATIFETAWRPFERASDALDALGGAAAIGTSGSAPGTSGTAPGASGNALGASRAAAVAMVGGLAGGLWGSSGLPVAARGCVAASARARQLVDRLIETDDPARDGRAWQTSTSAPLEVCRVDVSGAEPAVGGWIGITPLPGRRYVAYHTGAHWRDLDTDVRRLRALGTDLVFLLVEDRELVRCRVTGIANVLGDHGIAVVWHPIRDPLVPRDLPGFRAAVSAVLGEVRRGRHVAVVCRGGLDRSGMAAACLLREAGLDGPTSIERVQVARPGALALPDQQAFVRAWPVSASS